MDLRDAVVLALAGAAAGAVNAIAGGGSLITFPSLVAVGLPPVVANVTNSVAVAPGYLAAVAGSFRDLGEQRGRLLRLFPTVIVGTVAGCLLLLYTPATAFERVVPFLVLGAALMLAFQRRLRSIVGHPHQMSTARRALALHAMVGVGCVYGGYFGAALGVMLVALLGLVVDASLVRITAMKNVISALEGLTTVLVFAVAGPVRWSAVVVLAPATIVGGYAGARLARRMPAAVLRMAIVLFAVVIAVVLFLRAF